MTSRCEGCRLVGSEAVQNCGNSSFRYTHCLFQDTGTYSVLKKELVCRNETQVVLTGLQAVTSYKTEFFRHPCENLKYHVVVVVVVTRVRQFSRCSKLPDRLTQVADHNHFIHMTHTYSSLVLFNHLYCISA